MKRDLVKITVLNLDSMNMTKQYRTELRVLRKSKAKLERDFVQFEREHQKKAKALRRDHQRSVQSVAKSMNRIDERIAILEGRLS